MKFSLPGVPQDEAMAALEHMREACGAPENTRPHYSITYEDDGAEVVATVGEDEVITVFFAGEAYWVFEGPEDWRSVPVESVTEMVFFDDD